MKSIFDELLKVAREPLRGIKTEPLLYSFVFAVLFVILIGAFGDKIALHYLLLFFALYLGGLIFLIVPRRKDPHSAGEATELFRHATSVCCWLGIAGTYQFRACITSPERDERRLISIITRRRGSSMRYEFLFINPFSESFEERMKEERKNEYDLWRVRNMVLELSTELAKKNKEVSQAGNDLWIGFHCAPLVWNMIIVDKTIYLGSYVLGKPGHVRPLLRIDPSAEANDSFHRYYRHLHAAAFHLKGDYDRQELQRELIRQARTWDHPGCNPYTGLRKSNVLYISPVQEQAIKVFASAQGFSSEDIGLTVLRTVFSDVIPAITEKDKGKRTIIRQYYIGPTLYEIFMTLKQIENQESQSNTVVANKVSALRKRLIEKNEEWLARFQHPDVQGRLRAALDADRQRVYPFHQKTCESLEMFKEHLSIDSVYWSDISKIMDSVCDRLNAAACVFLRDANPKNIILCRSEMVDVRERPKILAGMLQQTDIDELAESLWKDCCHIDFESVSLLSTRFDDYVHLYGSPSVANVEQPIHRMATIHHKDQDSELFNCTVLFRSIRSLARRVYYKYEDPSTYEARYKDECRKHFAVLAKEAAQKLMSVPGALGEEMKGMSAFLHKLVQVVS